MEQITPATLSHGSDTRRHSRHPTNSALPLFAPLSDGGLPCGGAASLGPVGRKKAGPKTGRLERRRRSDRLEERLDLHAASDHVFLLSGGRGVVVGAAFETGGVDTGGEFQALGRDVPAGAGEERVGAIVIGRAETGTRGDAVAVRVVVTVRAVRKGP